MGVKGHGEQSGSGVTGGQKAKGRGLGGSWGGQDRAGSRGAGGAPGGSWGSGGLWGRGRPPPRGSTTTVDAEMVSINSFPKLPPQCGLIVGITFIKVQPCSGVGGGGGGGVRPGPTPPPPPPRTPGTKPAPFSTFTATTSPALSTTSTLWHVCVPRGSGSPQEDTAGARGSQCSPWPWAPLSLPESSLNLELQFTLFQLCHTLLCPAALPRHPPTPGTLPPPSSQGLHQ